MKRIKKLYENVDSELEKLKEFGYKKIDSKNIGNHTLILLYNSEFDIYEVSLTSFDQDFTTFSSQAKKSPRDSKEIIKTWKMMISQLKKWVDEFGILIIGSLNKERTYTYHRILAKIGLKVGEITNDSAEGPFPESWNFIIVK